MEGKILSTFANSTRLKLLLCLSEGEKNVTQLIAKCGLAQSAVSQHLEKLRIAGLVDTERKGKEIYYSLTDKKTAKISRNLLNFCKEAKHD